MLTEIIDKEIQTLEADLAAVRRGESPPQSLAEAESTRLSQAINALHRVRTAALVGAIEEAQTHNHEKPLNLRSLVDPKTETPGKEWCIFVWDSENDMGLAAHSVRSAVENLVAILDVIEDGDIVEMKIQREDKTPAELAALPEL